MTLLCSSFLCYNSSLFSSISSFFEFLANSSNNLFPSCILFCSLLLFQKLMNIRADECPPHKTKGQLSWEFLNSGVPGPARTPSKTSRRSFQLDDGHAVFGSCINKSKTRKQACYTHIHVHVC